MHQAYQPALPALNPCTASSADPVVDLRLFAVSAGCVGCSCQLWLQRPIVISLTRKFPRPTNCCRCIALLCHCLLLRHCCLPRSMTGSRQSIASDWWLLQVWLVSNLLFMGSVLGWSCAHHEWMGSGGRRLLSQRPTSQSIALVQR